MGQTNKGTLNSDVSVHYCKNRVRHKGGQSQLQSQLQTNDFIRWRSDSQSWSLSCTCAVKSSADRGQHGGGARWTSTPRRFRLRQTVTKVTEPREASLRDRNERHEDSDPEVTLAAVPRTRMSARVTHRRAERRRLCCHPCSTAGSHGETTRTRARVRETSSTGVSSEGDRANSHRRND